jgi:hypothetical protein
MRYLLIAIVAVMTAFSTGEAHAGRRQVFSGNGQTVSRGDGPFARLMELERRKNAAIRDMFRR